MPNIGDKPHQPASSFLFPKSKIGSQNRNFQHKWFDRFPWIHYNESEDKVYCFLCVKCIKDNLKGDHNFSKSEAFTYVGFNFWNKGKERFLMHQSSEEHIWAKLQIQASKTAQVDEILEKQCETQRALNRKCFIKVLQNILYLSTENIAFRGLEKSDSKFYNLVKLRALDDENLMNWIEKKRGNYLHHEIQNEILKIMANTLMRDHILKRIYEGYIFHQNILFITNIWQNFLLFSLFQQRDRLTF